MHVELHDFCQHDPAQRKGICHHRPSSLAIAQSAASASLVESVSPQNRSGLTASLTFQFQQRAAASRLTRLVHTSTIRAP